MPFDPRMFSKLKSQNPILKHIESEEGMLLVYGTEQARKQIRRSCMLRFRGKPSDIRQHFLTIDTFNNILEFIIRNKLDFTTYCKHKGISGEVLNFIQAHYDRINSHKDFIDIDRNLKDPKLNLEELSDSQNDFFKLACVVGIDTAREFNIPIYFILDQIDFSEIHPDGRHFNKITSFELRKIHEGIQSAEEDMSHIKFVEHGKEVSHHDFMMKMSESSYDIKCT